MRRRRSSVPAALVLVGSSLLLLGLASCGGEDVLGPGDVATVEVTPSSATLNAVGATRQFEATARSAGGEAIPDEQLDFAWSVADPDVGSITADGTFTAEANGETEVRASVAGGTGGVSGSARVTVEQTVSSVELSPSSSELEEPGDTQDFDATALDANGNPVQGADLQWSTTDESVITVDQEGTATAEGEGTADVVAAAGDVDGSASVEVLNDAITIEGDRSVGDKTYDHPVTVASGATLTVTGTTVEVNGKLTVEEGGAIEGTDETRLDLVVKGDLEVRGTISSEGHLAMSCRRDLLPTDEELAEGAGSSGFEDAPESSRDKSLQWTVSGRLETGTAPSSGSSSAESHGGGHGDDGADGGTLWIEDPLVELQMKPRQQGQRNVVAAANAGQPGEDVGACGATGGNGGDGGDVLAIIGGPVSIGDVTIRGGDGGRGGNSRASGCPDGTVQRGGDGGKPGRFLIRSEREMTIGGDLRIEGFSAGRGGHAEVTGQAGWPGAGVTAIGGDSPQLERRLVSAVDFAGGSVTLDVFDGADGGDATAAGGAGVSAGLLCAPGCDGGPGTAEGGDAKDVTLNTGNLQVGVGIGPAGTPGDGGDATASGGPGGDGGVCKLLPAPSGGAGGPATADGGDPGDLNFDAPPASETGEAGQESESPGGDGADGVGLQGRDLVIIPDWAAVQAQQDGTITAGTQARVPAFDSDENRLGTMPISFPEGAFRDQNDLGEDRLWLQDGQRLVLHTDAFEEFSPEELIALLLLPEQATGVGPSNPIRVKGFNGEGEKIFEKTIEEVPDNSDNEPGTRQELEKPFEGALGEYKIQNPDASGLARVEVVAPPGAALTLFEFAVIC